MIGSSKGETFESEFHLALGRPMGTGKEKNSPAASVEAPGPIVERDLDKRPPPILPDIGPVPSIAPHNPNPPGGGISPIKPGERIGDALPDVPSPPIVPSEWPPHPLRVSANWKGEGADMEGPHLPLDENQEWVPEISKATRDDWQRIEADPTGREPGYRITYPTKAPLTS